MTTKELIKPLLTFPHKDSFYFCQILQRKKDHKGTALGGSNNNSRLIKAYYITSVAKLEVHWEEMATLANIFNARVSINLNPRSFEKTAFAVLQKIANQMANKDFYNVRKAYDSEIPSKSGIHLITNPFNLAKFSLKWPRIEIHKNNPTNLYIP